MKPNPPRKRAPARRPAPSAHLNLLADGQVPLRLDASLRAIAWRWNYALHNRGRWTGRDEAALRQREAIDTLVHDRFGLKDAQLARMVEAGLVEVSMPFRRESEGWECRIFPWEFVLATATRARRKALQREFTVVRHLERKARKGRPNRACLLYVECLPPTAPPDRFDFSRERALCRAAAAGANFAYHELLNPSLDALREAVATHHPRLVHIKGLDTHGARALDLLPAAATTEGDDARGRDGVVMAGAKGAVIEVDALDLAQALTHADALPDVVCLDLDNSAPRIAALCVAAGARAAIGYQDRFDPALAELFYATFYRAWALAEGDTTAAFRFAWEQLRASGRRITGTGLVLWNAHSIADRATAAPDIDQAWRKRSERKPTADSVRDDLDVRIEPVDKLNYALLHNDRPLFRGFWIGKRREDLGAVEGIEVAVELALGQETSCWRRQVRIPATQPGIEIADAVRVSLAATLSRSVRENTHTSLHVEVSFEGVVLFRDTRRVTLLAVDEWQDSDADRKWLPSFVLPRDPAVAKVIARAQRYLQALSDEPTAGFDGYQSVIDQGKGRLDCDGVDVQVQALWCALLFDTPLAYINPPPTFTDSAQRLRTPSETLAGGRGTCIDLALLLAACLEYVEIHPTVILLSDHAFPCYWRADRYFENFALARSAAVGQMPQGDVSTGAATPDQSDSWYLVNSHFREVMAEIAAGRLVPIESTGLCWRHSFAQALDQGRANLSRRARFDSMLDIRAARIDRHAAVTPLPLLHDKLP